MFTIVGGDGKEYGPITAAHIREWIRDGRVNLQTKARYDRENVWKTLGDFPEFARQTATAPTPPPLMAARPDSASPAAAAGPEANLWLRLPAALVDGFLKTLCYLPITIPLARLSMAEALRGEERTLQELWELSDQVVKEHFAQALPFFLLLLLVQGGLLTWRSQTVGKLLFGLRIVRLPDQAPAGFVRAFLLRGTLPFLLEQIPLFGLLFWSVDTLFIFRADRRCLHDLLAGTQVVKT